MTATNKAWLRALEKTAPITGEPERILPVVIDELAARFGDTPALMSEFQCLTFRELAERAHRYARWALDQGLGKGETVCLLMPNRPEYMAVWLGITSVGGVVALLNTNLVGASLAHSVTVAAPSHIIVADALADRLDSAIAGTAKIWTSETLDHALERFTGEPLESGERPRVTIDDGALLIYTSGTTGLPKAARVSHFRIMQWSHWFAGLMETTPGDRMYDCLPMYHSVGGVLAIGAVLVGGGSVVVREKFSAAAFWQDIVRWDCTLFQYIGELCRYLVTAPPGAAEHAHRLRLACGNGLRPDVWETFTARFRIPRVLEFYAATEGAVSLFNVEGKPGAIGRVPTFLTHRVPIALVRFDVTTGEPVRTADGRCVRCGPDEVGEALGQGRFEGYTSADASDRKLLRDVFAPGDAWFRTGDLMRKDADGYFYFVDRVGDTFRFKGENVATSEVAEAIGAFPGVAEANVYGVAVPGADGRAGMAALVADPALDLTALRRHVAERLPDYARPRFLRLRPAMDVTATFKHTKQELVREGYDPGATDDRLYFDDRDRQAFVRLDEPLYRRLQTGQVRL